MANMRASLAAGALVLVAWGWGAPAYAHGVERVQRELTEQGFVQLEFQRTKPPFKLDACRDGQRFHLHVDFYGKVTEQTPIGSCGEVSTGAPDAASPSGPPLTDASSDEAAASSITSPDADPPPKRSRGAEKSPKQAPEQELCARYFPEIGKTLQVPCAR